MSSFSFTSDTPTNPWIVQHDLNDPNPFWVVYQTDGESILPTSAVATSPDVFPFTFDAAVAGAGRVLSVLDLVSFASTVLHQGPSKGGNRAAQLRESCPLTILRSGS